MSQDEHQQPDAKDGEREPEKSGIGALFRDEREKRDLDYTQVFETTRIRPHILQALEDEDWDRLPSPVLVKGFIRSYARALGLEEGKVLELYSNATRVEAAPHMPLKKRVRSRKALFVILISIFLLLAMATGYYLWKKHAIHEIILSGDDTINALSYEIANPADVRGEQIDDEVESVAPNKEEESAVVQEGSVGSEVKTDELILKADVRVGTWLRIFVDDQEPREFIFRPGNQLEWRGNQGFDLLIGNAGGIDFEFNGEKIKNLGALGQVIHLTFPEDYKRRGLEN